jgi:hypothetical protein
LSSHFRNFDFVAIWARRAHSLLRQKSMFQAMMAQFSRCQGAMHYAESFIVSPKHYAQRIAIENADLCRSGIGLTFEVILSRRLLTESSFSDLSAY